MNINLLTDDELSALKQLILEAGNIVILAHRSPDGDAVGASLSMGYLLEAMGKAARVVLPDQYPDFLQWLPGTQNIVRADKHKDLALELVNKADLIFCLDFNTASRLDDMADALLGAKARKVLIDHHLNPDILTALTVSRPDMTSTSEMIFRIAYQMGLWQEMTQKCAVTVYTGMMTDTGGFTYNSSNPETYFIISQLLTKGIDKDKIYRNVYHNYSLWRMRLMGFVLYARLVTNGEKHASYFTLSREDLHHFHFIKGDAEGLVNLPLQIKGMRLSISLREDTERRNLIWVSLRSVDDFPCNIMAERYFNGGGHLNASGGRLECSLAEAEAIVKRAIDEFC